MTLRLADIIAQDMEARGLKGPAEAARLGVTHGAFYNWLNGVSLPPRKQAERLAKKLGRPDLVELVSRERERNRTARKKRAGAAP